MSAYRDIFPSDSLRILHNYHCVRSGLILLKTRPTLFPMVQEYLRIIVR